MDASAWAGWYAASVSTAVAGWQFYVHREKTVRLKVKLNTSIFSGAPTGMNHAIAYRITNKSGVAVIVKEVGRIWEGTITPIDAPGEQLPLTIPPRETASVYVNRYYSFPKVGPSTMDYLGGEGESRFYALTDKNERYTSQRIRSSSQVMTRGRIGGWYGIEREGWFGWSKPRDHGG